jgi:hypothetical protein
MADKPKEQAVNQRARQADSQCCCACFASTTLSASAGQPHYCHAYCCTWAVWEVFAHCQFAWNVVGAAPPFRVVFPACAQTCPQCGVVKVAEEYYCSKHGIGGLHTYCKACARGMLRRNYDNTRHALAAFKAAQEATVGIPFRSAAEPGSQDTRGEVRPSCTW